ncbi:Slam-dependent surface lipoprotein, partial [Glaesserella parasuis]|nr:Slam-dependent surface lipoprotein [Glaesserella parasuis]
KEEAERLAAEQAEKDRLAKEEAERLAAEEKARQEKLASFIAIAKQAGLTDEEATQVAQDNLDGTQDNLSKAIEDFKAAKLQDEIDAAKAISSYQYPVKQVTASSAANSSSVTNALTNESRVQTVVYNQPYSAVIANYSGNVSYNNRTGQLLSDNRTTSIEARGLKTSIDAIPQEGQATYSGYAFNGSYSSEYNWNTFEREEKIMKGNVNYTVNFTDRTGSGTITGLGDDIQLGSGTISGSGITSNATQGYRSGNYSLEFFGPKAEEIGGKVSLNGKETIGFGGSRGEIQK